MLSPILLLTPAAATDAIANALRGGLDIEVEATTNRHTVLACLRQREYLLVLVDEGMAAEDLQATDLLYRSAGSTPVLEINFALSGAARIVRQVRSALTRRAFDRAQAQSAATLSLQNELNATLSGLLLESQLLMRDASPQLEPKLRHVVELAGDLRERLRA
jgi:hypothetical protein